MIHPVGIALDLTLICRFLIVSQCSLTTLHHTYTQVCSISLWHEKCHTYMQTRTYFLAGSWWPKLIFFVIESLGTRLYAQWCGATYEGKNVLSPPTSISSKHAANMYFLFYHAMPQFYSVFSYHSHLCKLVSPQSSKHVVDHSLHKWRKVYAPQSIGTYIL